MTTELWIRIAIAIAVLIGAWLLNRLVKRSIRHFSQRYNLPEKDPGAETRFRMIALLTSLGLYFLALGVAFWIVDQEALKKVATVMFASAGVAGIAVGFAAQTVFSNLISGIIIAFVQPVRLGDLVNIDGDNGRVRSIGLFYTTIRVWDNRHLLIPNKLLSDRIIENYTLVDPKMAALVSLRLSYGADLEAVRTLLLETARNHPAALPEPEPVVQVLEADNWGLTVRLTVWTSSQSDAFDMAADIRETVTAKLDASELGTAVAFTGSATEGKPA